MPGSVTGIAVMATVAGLTVSFGMIAAAAVHAQRLASAADSAALAAADAASGAVAGIPCERAAEVAATAGAQVAECTLERLIATVTVTSAFGPLATAASARAGPPP